TRREPSTPAREELRRAAATALADQAPPEVRVAAVDALSRTGIHNRVLRLAELVNGAQPWPVAEAAMRALRALDADPTDGLSRRWLATCERRLEEAEEEAVDLAGYAEQRRLTDERRRLLTELASAARYDVLLRHRFRFDLAHHVARLLAPLADRSVSV